MTLSLCLLSARRLLILDLYSVQAPQQLSIIPTPMPEVEIRSSERL